jgi:hypothetical protein
MRETRAEWEALEWRNSVMGDARMNPNSGTNKRPTSLSDKRMENMQPMTQTRMDEEHIALVDEWRITEDVTPAFAAVIDPAIQEFLQRGKMIDAV